MSDKTLLGRKFLSLLRLVDMTLLVDSDDICDPKYPRISDRLLGYSQSHSEPPSAVWPAENASLYLAFDLVALSPLSSVNRFGLAVRR